MPKYEKSKHFKHNATGKYLKTHNITFMKPDIKTNKTPEEIEREWYERVYKGNVPQLTLRAVVMGMILGGVMSLSNLYVGLKTGLGLGVSITACILSYSIYTTLCKLMPKIFKTKMSILENNAMQSTASSAGSATGATMVSAIAALLIFQGHHLPFWTLFFWTIFLAMFGIFLAIPIKRQMINIEQLKFPSGIAVAEILKSLHSHGEEAVKKARSAGIAGLLGAIVAWLRDGKTAWMQKLNLNIPDMLKFPGLIRGAPLIKYTFGLDISLIMIALGSIIGLRTCWSMLLGAIINYGYLAPKMYSMGVIKNLGYRGIVSWSLWTGVAIMVTSALFTFAVQWRTILWAFSSLGSIFKKTKSKVLNPLERIEVPGSWFLAGILVSGGGCIFMQIYSFKISLYLAVIAVLITFFLTIVVCRVTGETDMAPCGSVSKLTQLTYGILAPSNMVTNLMTACITAGSSASAADLITNLKSGYLLGANSRKQFWAQFLGIFAGAAVIVPAFYLIVPNASVLGSDKFPAPSAQVWKSVAELLSKGIYSLDPTVRWGLLIGGVIGIIISILEMIFPKHKKYIPSAMGLGLSMVLPAWNTISMFIGASIAAILHKVKPKVADDYVIPVSSGLIAGESLMGVAIALLIIAGIIAR